MFIQYRCQNEELCSQPSQPSPNFVSPEINDTNYLSPTHERYCSLRHHILIINGFMWRFYSDSEYARPPIYFILPFSPVSAVITRPIKYITVGKCAHNTPGNGLSETHRAGLIRALIGRRVYPRL